MSIQLKGFDDINRGLDRLDRSLRADVLIDALQESAQPMERAYKNGAPRAVWRGIRTRVVTKTPSIQEIAVGTKHPLAHIFEFGTRRRRTKKGARRGRIQAIGFARRAFDTNVTGWFGQIGAAIARRLPRGGR